MADILNNNMSTHALIQLDAIPEGEQTFETLNKNLQKVQTLLNRQLNLSPPK